jgi:hypothetical protein
MARETGPCNLIRQTGLASSRLTDDEYETVLLQCLPQQGLGIAFHVGRRQPVITVSVCGVNTSQFRAVQLVNPGNAARRIPKECGTVRVGKLRPHAVGNKGVDGRDGCTYVGGQRTGRPRGCESHGAATDPHSC